MDTQKTHRLAIHPYLNTARCGERGPKLQEQRQLERHVVISPRGGEKQREVALAGHREPLDDPLDGVGEDPNERLCPAHLPAGCLAVRYA